MANETIHEYHVPYTDGTAKTLKTDTHHSKYAQIKDWVNAHPVLSAGIGTGVTIAVDQIRHIRTYKKP